MTTEAAFEWDDRYLLGHGPMDDVHREFVTLVNALLTVEDAGLPDALEAFAVHAVAHFEQESRWMENGFPAADCHAEEHDKVLASVREVQQHLAEGGDPAVARELAEALMDWFPAHADYMDSALATWLVKRAHGGAPLVFRRESAKA